MTPGERDAPVCIYLDGLSNAVHGRAETASRDRAIREELRARGYEVIEIPHSHLADRDAMIGHFSRLARYLLGRERSLSIRNDPSWFVDGNS